jgi:hypothetical protein
MVRRSELLAGYTVQQEVSAPEVEFSGLPASHGFAFAIAAMMPAAQRR